MKTGRNDPCPCGSGRKFKHCCAQPAGDARVAITDDDRAQAFALLDRLSQNPRFAEDMELATGLMNEGGGPSPLDDPDDFVQIGWFLDWFAFDVLLRPSNTTLAEYAIRTCAAELTPGSRQFIRAMQNAPLRLLQVQTLFLGSVALCKDQLDPPRQYRVLSDRHPLERHAVLVARIIEREGDWEIEGEPGFVELIDRRRIIRSVLRLRRGTTAAEASPALQRMIEGAALVRIMAANEAMLDAELETVEGDPIDPVIAHYRIVDGNALTRALAGAADFVMNGDSSYTWEQPGAKKKERYALGHLTIEGESLKVTAVTPQRAERVRNRLADVAGDCVAFTRLERVAEAADPGSTDAPGGGIRLVTPGSRGAG